MTITTCAACHTEIEDSGAGVFVTVDDGDYSCAGHEHGTDHVTADIDGRWVSNGDTVPADVVAALGLPAIATKRTETLNWGRKYPFNGALFAQVKGRQAVYVTTEGRKLVGTIYGQDNTAGGRYLTAQFPDGRWARLDSVVHLVRQH